MTTVTPHIEVRKVDFEFDNIERYYAGGSIFRTHYMNSMHIVFPEGEKFFIRSARRYMDQIKDDPELLDRVKKFIGQEGVHHKEHEKFWDILKDMGLKPRAFAKFYNYTAYNFIEKNLFRLMGKKRGNLLALSVTTALEHFTALLGDGGLRTEDLFDKLPKNVRMLMLWHAAEELEHKSVCFDLYEKVGGDYSTRVAGMVFATIFLWLYLGAGQMYFVATDKEATLSKLPKDLIQFYGAFFSSRGTANIRKMYFDYYKKDFHPDDHDNYHLAEDFFEENKAFFEEMGI